MLTNIDALWVSIGCSKGWVGKEQEVGLGPRSYAGSKPCSLISTEQLETSIVYSELYH